MLRKALNDELEFSSNSGSDGSFQLILSRSLNHDYLASKLYKTNKILKICDTGKLLKSYLMQLAIIT